MGVRNREKVKSSEDNFETKSAGYVQLNEVIPVIEEEILFDKKVVKNKTLIIEKKITSEEVSVDVPLTTEHINVERVGMNQFLDSQPSVRYDGDTIIIPVTREVVVKRLLLVEEIRISKQLETKNQSEKIILKKEEVTVKEKEK